MKLKAGSNERKSSEDLEPKWSEELEAAYKAGAGSVKPMAESGGQLKYPLQPAELWMLWMVDRADWVPAMDLLGNPRLCFLSYADAEEGADDYRAVYRCKCVPRRIGLGG